MAKFRFEHQGSKYEVEANSQEEADNKMLQAFGGQEQEVSTARQLEAGVQGAANLLTADHADRILAGIGTGGGYLGDYDKTLKSIRERMDETSRLAPGSELLGGVAAGFVPVAGQVGRVASVVKGGSRLLGLGKLAAKGAGAGAAYEGLATHGRDRGDTTPDDYVDNMLQGGLVGGVAGPVGAGILAGGRKLLKGKSKTSSYSDRLDEVHKMKPDSYKKVDRDTTAVRDNPLRDAIDEGKAKLKGSGYAKNSVSSKLIRLLERDLKDSNPTKVPGKTTKKYSGMDDDGYPRYETKTTKAIKKPAKRNFTVKDSMDMLEKINMAVNKAKGKGGKDYTTALAIKKAYMDSLQKAVTPKAWDNIKTRNSLHQNTKTYEKLKKELSKDVLDVDKVKALARDTSLPPEVRKLLSDAAKDPSKAKSAIKTLARLPFGISGGIIDIASGRGLQGAARLTAALGSRAINSKQRGKLNYDLQDKLFDQFAKKEALAPMNKGLLSTGLGASGAGLFSDGEY